MNDPRNTKKSRSFAARACGAQEVLRAFGAQDDSASAFVRKKGKKKDQAEDLLFSFMKGRSKHGARQ